MNFPKWLYFFRVVYNPHCWEKGKAMNFYETLAEYMQEKNITASELSKLTGIRKQYFSDLKSGKAKDVSWVNALKIIKALGVPLDEFTKRNGWDI